MAVLLAQSRFFLLHETIHKQGHPLPDFHIFLDLQIYLCNKICITYTPSPAKRIITLHANKIFKGGGKEGLRPPLIVKTKKKYFFDKRRIKVCVLDGVLGPPQHNVLVSLYFGKPQMHGG